MAGRRRGNAGRGGPARGYSWAKAGPGNDLAVTHGAQSRRLVEPAAAALLAEIRADAPPWIEDVDWSAMQSWAWAQATVSRLRVYLGEHGELDDQGKARPAAELALRWERRLDTIRAALGFDPAARARLGRDTAMAQAAVVTGLRHATDIGAAIVADREATGDE